MKLDQRRAFLFLGITILFWMMFWNTGIRRMSVYRNSVSTNSNSKFNAALRGALIAV